MFQYREAANFPWRSQAAWLYSQMIRWDSSRYSESDAATAAGVFRPDIYRAALTGTTAPLPGARSNIEGGLGAPIRSDERRVGKESESTCRSRWWAEP